MITALVEKHGHVPYRDNKLTRLLQESLGGRAKTTIVPPSLPQLRTRRDLKHTELREGMKNIENRPEVNQRMTKRALIREYAWRWIGLSRSSWLRGRRMACFSQRRYDELLESKQPRLPARGALTARPNSRLMARFQISQTELDSVRAELAATGKLGSGYLLDAQGKLFRSGSAG